MKESSPHPLDASQSQTPIRKIVRRLSSWWSRCRMTFTLIVLTAAATLLVVWVASVVADVWHSATRATIQLVTDEGPLIAEFIGEDHQGSIPAETVPMQHPVDLAAGRNRLRLSGESLLSQEYAYWLHRGEAFKADLALKPQLLWDELEHQRDFHVVKLSSEESPGADVLLVDDEGIRLHDGKTAKERWQLNLVEPLHESLTENVELIWPWNRNTITINRGKAVGAFSVRPWIVATRTLETPVALEGDAVVRGASMPRFSDAEEHSVDLNGDGVSDLLIGARHQAWLVAVSGKDGAPLWIAARGNAVPEEGRRSRYGISGSVAYRPTVVEDQNEDGVEDILAVFADARQKDRPRRWLELLSGAGGETIWKSELPQSWFQLDQGAEVPYHLRWFYGSGGGISSSSSGGSGGFYARRGHSQTTRSGSHLYLPTRPCLVPRIAADPVTSESEPQSRLSSLAFVAGRRFVQLDLQTGQRLADDPPVIGVRPDLQPRYGDLDGDQQLDLLLTEQLPELPRSSVGSISRASVPRVRLSAWSSATGRLLWQHRIKAQFPRQPDEQLHKPDWPILADLDGDGASEVVSPQESTMIENRWRTPPSGTLQVLDGATGKARWRRELRNLDQQISHFSVGPDIDGDGWCELFVPTLWGDAPELFVDCLSGRDGRSLWRAQHQVGTPNHTNQDFHLVETQWYRWGGDGWPQLIVFVRDIRGASLDRSYLLSAGTGRLMHLGRGIRRLQVADLDGDQVSDLVCESESGDRQILNAYRGHGRERWRHVSPVREVVGDLNGDRVRDLVITANRKELVAHSGATGKVLWRSWVPNAWRYAIAAAAEHHSQNMVLPSSKDLDGDGNDDLLLVFGYQYDGGPLVQAISGRSGRRLWRSDVEVHGAEDPALVECRDLDGDGQPEVIVVSASAHGTPQQAGYNRGDGRLWLFVLSGRDGTTRWQCPLTADPRKMPVKYEFRRLALEAGYVDVDRDGTLDLVLPAQAEGELQREELRAISGVDGRTLWQHGLPPMVSQRQESLHNTPPIAGGDVDGDGRAEIVALSLDRAADDSGPARDVLQVTLLEGATGRTRWQWQTPANHHSLQVGRNSSLVHSRIRPLLLQRAQGQRWITIWTREGRRHQLHVISEEGKTISRSETTGAYHRLRPWACDADGDGNDELSDFRNGSLALLSAEDLQPIWQLRAARLSDGEPVIPHVAGVVLGADGRPQLVIQGIDGNKSLCGVDAATGKTAWRCMSPGASLRYPSSLMNTESQRPGLLSKPRASHTPLVRFRFGDVSVCRQAVSYQRTSDAGSLTPSKAAFSARRTSRAAATLHPAGHDPRYLRPLPWKPSERDVERLPMSIAAGIFYGLTLAVLPVALLASLVRRRRWGMKAMFLLPVVVAIFLMAASVELPYVMLDSVSDRVVFAYFGAGPVLLTLLLLAVWGYRRQWRRLITALGVAVALGLIIITVAVFGPIGGNGLMPGERWSWDGWYGIFFPLGFALSWLMTLGVPVIWMLGWLRRRRANQISTAGGKQTA